MTSRGTFDLSSAERRKDAAEKGGQSYPCADRTRCGGSAEGSGGSSGRESQGSGRSAPPHALKGFCEGETQRSLVLQEGSGLQQVRSQLQK